MTLASFVIKWLSFRPKSAPSSTDNLLIIVDSFEIRFVDRATNTKLNERQRYMHRVNKEVSKPFVAIISRSQISMKFDT